MNMNKALQHLYKAVSGEDTTKRNISKLLVDIHTALTGEAPENKNNHAKIIDSLAENWSGGGGGSSFAKITVSITNTGEENDVNVMYRRFSFVVDNEWSNQYLITVGAGNTVSKDLYMPLYEGEGIPLRSGNEFTTDSDVINLAAVGGVVWDNENNTFSFTGDGSISITAINQGAQ